MKKPILLILCCLVVLTGFGQKARKQRLAERKQRYEIAAKQIQMLKDGALLVRLFTKEKNLAALRKKGQNEFADKIEQRQQEYNQRIVDAFKQAFFFCPVFFFYSHDSKYVREGNLEAIEFLNDSLNIDKTIKPFSDDCKFYFDGFLVAEFTTVLPDTAGSPSRYTIEPGEEGRTSKTEYYTASENGFYALVIKSDQFIQLRDPFRYYARSSEYDNPLGAVKRMDHKLRVFYLRHAD